MSPLLHLLASKTRHALEPATWIHRRLQTRSRNPKINSYTMTSKSTPQSTFRYLINLPTIAISDLGLNELDCPICADIFQINAPNQQVRLQYGHLLGLACIACWAFSPYFSNRCPSCRQKIISEVSQQQQPARSSGEDSTAQALVVLEILDAMSGPVLPIANKAKLLEALDKHFDEKITVLLYSYVEALETHARPRRAAIQAPQRQQYFMSELNFYFALLVLASKALICIADSIEHSPGAITRLKRGRLRYRCHCRLGCVLMEHPGNSRQAWC